MALVVYLVIVFGLAALFTLGIWAAVGIRAWLNRERTS